MPLWWKEAFKDPVLDQLVDDALADNLTLRSAALRVLQARQQLLIVANLRLPQEQYLGGSAAVTDPGESSGVSAAYSATFNLTWEIDVWGRIRRQVESASAAYDATLSSYDGVLVLVIGQVAQTYLLIRTTEQRLAAARQNLAYQNESVRISEAKLEAGDISSLDVEQGLTLVYNTRGVDRAPGAVAAAVEGLAGHPPRPAAPGSERAAGPAGTRSGRVAAARARHAAGPDSPPAGHPRGRAPRGRAERPDRGMPSATSTRVSD